MDKCLGLRPDECKGGGKKILLSGSYFESKFVRLFHSFPSQRKSKGSKFVLHNVGRWGPTCPVREEDLKKAVAVNSRSCSMAFGSVVKYVHLSPFPPDPYPRVQVQMCQKEDLRNDRHPLWEGPMSPTTTRNHEWDVSRVCALRVHRCHRNRDRSLDGKPEPGSVTWQPWDSGRLPSPQASVCSTVKHGQ